MLIKAIKTYNKLKCKLESILNKSTLTLKPEKYKLLGLNLG